MSTEKPPESKSEKIEEYEHVDPETLIEDIGELFQPDNKQLPPLNPDTPPIDEGAGVHRLHPE